jgi:hypothetical protein
MLVCEMEDKIGPVRGKGREGKDEVGSALRLTARYERVAVWLYINGILGSLFAFSVHMRLSTQAVGN